MLNRRQFCTCLSAAAALACAPALAEPALAEPADCDVFTPDLQSAVTPDAAIERLLAGNARFLAGQPVSCDLMQQVQLTAGRQAPFAAIVGCIDSRVPPELVFDQGIGDVFCARIAGNFVDVAILGSLEFACAVAGARAILVLGHSHCGAVKGAIDDVRLGNLTAMLANIRPSVDLVQEDGDRTSRNELFVQLVAEANVRRAVQMMGEDSPVLAALVGEGKLRIAGAMHDLATGRVTLLA